MWVNNMKDINFEGAMAKLEEAVLRLEGGELSLDESIKLFEDAIALVRMCNEKLANAEQRVKILVEGADGSVSDAPFACDNEN